MLSHERKERSTSSASDEIRSSPRLLPTRSSFRARSRSSSELNNSYNNNTNNAIHAHKDERGDSRASPEYELQSLPPRDCATELLPTAPLSRTALVSPNPPTVLPASGRGAAYELQYFDNKPYAAGPLVKQLGNPTPLGLCVFATTLTSLSFFLMGFRGTTIPNVLIGNFFFLGGLGLLIAGQWEILIGNTFGFVVFCSFGGFFLSFGAILGPTFGVLDAYEGAMDQYYNALGFYLVGFCILLFVFMVAALRTNIVFVSIFVSSTITLSFLATSYFLGGSGDMVNFVRFRKIGGAFALLTGLIGWYLIFAQLFIHNGFDITLPVGDLSHKWCKKKPT